MNSMHFFKRMMAFADNCAYKFSGKKTLHITDFQAANLFRHEEQGSRLSMQKGLGTTVVLSYYKDSILYRSTNILLRIVTSSIYNIIATWAQYESRAVKE